MTRLWWVRPGSWPLVAAIVVSAVVKTTLLTICNIVKDEDDEQD